MIRLSDRTEAKTIDWLAVEVAKMKHRAERAERLNTVVASLPVPVIAECSDSLYVTGRLPENYKYQFIQWLNDMNDARCME